MDDIKKAVMDLNAGWYNVVCATMKLDPATFQLAQGTLGLQSSELERFVPDVGRSAAALCGQLL